MPASFATISRKTFEVLRQDFDRLARDQSTRPIMEDMKVTATGYDFRSAHAAMQRYVDGNLLSGFSSAVLVG